MTQYILNRPIAWSNTAKYEPTSNGQTVTIPMVTNAGRTYYLNGSANPVVGTAPASDAAWSVMGDGNTSYTAGTGLDLTGTTFSVEASLAALNALTNSVTGVSSIQQTGANTFANIKVVGYNNAAPTVSNDNTQGYIVGSLFINTGNNAIYSCTSATTGAATWSLIRGANNFPGTGAPGVGNDNTQGYAPGSLWQPTDTAFLYVCSDNTTGAAVWTKVLV